MTDYRIDVKVDPKGAETGLGKVDQRLQRTEIVANRLRNTVNRALAFAGVSVGIGQLTKLADTFTNIQNRLRTVTKSEAELVAVTKELFSVAQQTRASFEATAELYARVGLSVRELGISQQQTIEFTKSLNQAVLLSGATAVEAEAGLIQLSQGLASGALRGDELRSVLEQLPVVADVIAKSLGVTRGELRELGTEGKISAETVITAFAEAREELENNFGKAVPTLGQSFTVLNNAIMQYVGELDQSFGVTTRVAKAIILLSQNIDVAAKALQALSIVIGVQFARRAIPAAVTALRTLALALAANPIGAIAVAITAAIALLISFAHRIRISSESFITLQDVGSAALDFLKEGVQLFINFFSDNFGFIADFASQIFGEVNISIEGVVRFAAKVIDSFIGIWVGAFKAVVTAWGFLPSAFKDIFTRALNGAVKLVENGLNKIIGAINKVTDFVGIGTIDPIQLSEAENNYEGAGERLAEAVIEGFKTGFDSIGIAVPGLDALLKRAEEKARERLAAQQAAEAERERQRAALGASPGGPSTTGIPTLTTAEIDDLKDRLKSLQDDLLARTAEGAIALEQSAYQDRIALLIQAEQQGLTIIGGFQNAREELEKQHQDNLREIRTAAAQDFITGISDLTSNIESIYSSRFRIQQNALNALVRSEKDRIQELVDSGASDAVIKQETDAANERIRIQEEYARRAFENQKNAQVASALVNGLSAVVASYNAGAQIGGPAVGALFAAAAAEATRQQINAIQSTQFNGGGSITAPSSTSNTAPQEGVASGQSVPQQVIVQFSGQNFSKSEVVDIIKEATGNDEILFEEGTAQFNLTSGVA